MKRMFLLLIPLLLSSCYLDMRDNLITASRNLDYPKVQYHVKNGADLNYQDYNGFTPLIMAAYYDNVPIVEYLCESGADINIQEDDGWTALSYASYFGFENVVRVLLKYNASVDLRNKWGYTALWYAENANNERIIKMLKDPKGEHTFISPSISEPNDNLFKGERIEFATTELVRKAPPLKTNCKHIIFTSFDISDDLKRSYPEAPDMCKNAIIDHLRRKNVYANVTANADLPYPSNTVLIDGMIEQMYAANTAARVVFGGLVGTPIIDVRISLTDSDTKTLIHQKVISTTVNAWHAGVKMGTSDKYLPMGMGEIIGEYLYTILPAQQ